MSADIDTAREVLQGYETWVRQQNVQRENQTTIAAYMVWYADQVRINEHGQVWRIAANPELHHSEIGLEIRKILGLQDVDVQGEERL